MSVFVWAMVGIALWHFAILVPDRFYGGIIGAFLAAFGGGILAGFLLPTPGVPLENPPGVGEALWPIPGALLGLAASYWYGARRDAARPPADRPLRAARPQRDAHAASPRVRDIA